MRRGRTALTGESVVKAVVAAMVDKKAEEIVVYDMRGVPAIGEWFVICSANGPVHARAVAEGVVTALRQRRRPPVYQEGVEDGRWALIDYIDVVVHVMIPEMREYYSIEELWRAGRRYGPEKFSGTRHGKNF